MAYHPYHFVGEVLLHPVEMNSVKNWKSNFFKLGFEPQISSFTH